MSSYAPGRIRAILGPTNTGKTHLAIDRMLGHTSGMIGFPLRLLARENYDRIVAAKGARAVALITGEEKIIPPSPRWFVCTVESMPVDRLVEFLAVDEIQLCADPERGHVFTDRLLHARGISETMFLGSDTVGDLVRRLVPEAHIETRQRLSTLTYTGPKKLTRLPRRSAVVAFSVAEVYALAELIRRQRGGTAVVLGALSPRTRNAQVAMYQEGEVDYMVATDAIGMGLNMDVDHVAFANTRKFDGRRARPLTHAEIGQIAGRAGRYMNDGTFGTTNDSPPLDDEAVQAVEGHRFDAVKRLYWRNCRLDFASPKFLLKSLELRPPRIELIRARDGEDQFVLQRFVQDEEVTSLATNPAAVRMLWEVCQIPDFRKVMPDHHAVLLKRIYLALAAGPDMEGRLPEDWVARQIDRLNVTTGDIDTLTNRIAYIRTWTYISHRVDWLDDAVHWQERTREIEDKLSDALHERLTQRFVDRRAAMIERRRKDGVELLSAVTASHQVIVEGESVGMLEGLVFVAEEVDKASRPVLAAARRAVAQAMPARVARLVSDDDGSFVLTPNGRVTWRGAAVARLVPGRTPLAPGIEVLRNDFLDNGAKESIRTRLSAWLDRHMRKQLRQLLQALEADLNGAARGLVFQISERLGSLPRRPVRDLLNSLTKADRKALTGLGLRFGAQTVFFPALLKPPILRLRAILWAVHSEGAAPPLLAPDGRVVDAPVLPSGGVPGDHWAAVGYVPLGSVALRCDRVEKLSAALRKAAKQGPFEESEALAALAGCSGAAFASVLGRLGFRGDPVENGILYKLKRRPNRQGKPGEKPAPRRPKSKPRKKPPEVDPASPFAALRDLAVAK
jgi:ATP-dependent RNA helicase SUPV3L1/SUV3